MLFWREIMKMIERGFERFAKGMQYYGVLGYVSWIGRVASALTSIASPATIR